MADECKNLQLLARYKPHAVSHLVATTEAAHSLAASAPPPAGSPPATPTGAVWNPSGQAFLFDTNGHLIRRFASRGALNSPWGMVRAPLDFGAFSSHVLMGNFGDGHISAFDSGGDFRGQLRKSSGNRITIDGLWGLIFGTGLAADSNTLYFTAGTDDEADGLFGTAQAAEPVEQHGN